MSTNDLQCAHACRNTCALLRDAIKREEELMKFYNEVNSLCDYPDIQTFIKQNTDQHRNQIENLRKKLSEMEEKGKVLDGVIASFDPSGV